MKGKRVPYSDPEKARKQRREWARRWRLKHPALARKKSKEDSRKWREKNPDKIREMNKRYSKYQAEWKRKHKKSRLSYYKKYERTKRDMVKKLKSNAEWRRRNVGRVLEIGATYRAANRSGERARSTEWRRKLSEDVKRFLGGKCECCSINEYEFLTVDHIENDGKLCTRNSNGTRNNFYYYTEIRKAFQSKDVLKVQEVFLKYRLLCFNCNNARSIYGQCPHERAKEFKVLK